MGQHDVAGAGTVLLVEPERAHRDRVQSMVESIGFAVRVATMGRGLLETLRAGVDPALALINPELGDMTLWELLGAIAEDTSMPLVPIAVMTADPSIVRAIRSWSRWPILRKPVDENALRKLLSSGLAAHRTSLTRLKLEPGSSSRRRRDRVG